MSEFRNFLKTFLESNDDRKDHLAWNKDDVQIINDDRLDEKQAQHGIHEEEDTEGHHLKEHLFSEEDHKHYADLHQKLSENQRKAVSLYKTRSGTFNKPLRKGTGIQHPRLEDLKSVTRNKTPSDMHGFRSFGDDFPIHHLKKGDIIHDKGFTGVSASHGVAAGFISPKYDENDNSHVYVAKIHIPKGTKAHLFDNRSSAYDLKHQNHEERETVLHPGTKFKVTGHSVTKLKGGKRHRHIIHMTVHSQED